MPPTTSNRRTGIGSTETGRTRFTAGTVISSGVHRHRTAGTIKRGGHDMYTLIYLINMLRILKAEGPGSEEDE